MIKRILFAMLVIALVAGGWAIYGLIDDDIPKARRLRDLGSPMSYDPAPIEVTIGGKQYAIPRNNIDAPLHSDSHDGNFRVKKSDLLLVGILPDFEGYSKKTWPELHKGAPTLRLYLTVSTLKFPASESFRTIKEKALAGARTLTGQTSAQRFGELRKDHDTYIDWYESVETGFFTTCNRIAPPVIVRICHYSWHDDVLIYKLMMNGIQLESREELRTLIMTKFREWEIASHKERRP